MLRWSIWLLSLQCSFGYYVLYDFDSYQAKMVVDEHNRLRAQESAADMQEMVWNSELALVAKDWASRCAAMHRPGDDRVNRAGFDVIGENIWWSSESYLRRDLASIVRSLYDEKPFFSYSSNWCQPGQMCGHYTQVVWAKTCAVGCAAAYCDYIYNGRGIASGHMVVCNYGPAGNYPHQFPYIYGSQCSLCPGSCRNGLCPSTCASNSWLPQAPAPPPQSQAPAPSPQVQVPAPVTQIVTTIPPPVTQPQSPAVIVSPIKPVISKPAPSNPVEKSRPVMPPNKLPSIDQPKSIFSSNKQEKIRTEIISDSCINQHPLCAFWGSTNECEKNQQYMLIYCRAVCDSSCIAAQQLIPEPKAAIPTVAPTMIHAENACIDRDYLCQFWANTGECESNLSWMNSNCYASCHRNECGGNFKTIAATGCHDENEYCNFWTSIGECGRNAFFMRWQCRKSCNFC